MSTNDTRIRVTLEDQGGDEVSVTGGALHVTGSVTPSGGKTDDTAFTPATDSVTVIGAFADESGPDSVDEGDAGAVRMTLARALHVNQRSAAGVDLTSATGVKTDPQSIKTFSALAGTGELAGSTSGAQNPTVACSMVMFKASYDNAGRVYIGGASITVADGSTDTTTGYQLNAGESTPWIPITNVNLTYRRTDNAGDDLTYFAL